MGIVLTRSDRVRRKTYPHRFHVVGFRGRNTDGDETDATWKAALDTVWAQETGAVPGFRARFVLLEMVGGHGFDPFVLQFSANGGPWTDVTGLTSSVVTYGGGAVPNGTDTTQQLSVGTYITPNAGYGSVQGAVGETAGFVGGEKLELEWALWLRPGFVNEGEPVGLRVRNLWRRDIPVHVVTPEFYRSGAVPVGGGRDPNEGQ